MATAQINDITINHNVWRGDDKGMSIRVDFNVQGLNSLHGSCVAYFNYWNGGPLIDFDGEYHSQDGHVSVGEDFIPQFYDTNFPDFTLFIPYNQLHMAPGDSDLMFHVVIWDESQIVPQKLATSAWYRFTFSLPGIS